MKTLITGGFGYIGSSIANNLNQKNYKISICSRYKKKPNEWTKKINVQNIEWQNNIKLEKLCHNHDVVIHTAGMNSIDCFNNPKDAVKCNQLNTKKLTLAAIKSEVKLLIYISTAHVYSSPLKGIINEKTKTINKHPYASSHQLGELEILNLTKDTKTKPIIIRLSNAYGIPIEKNINSWNLIINSFCLEATKNLSIELDSDGLEKRDFINLNDVNSAIELILKSQSDLPKGIYNLGSGISYTIIQIAKIIQNLMLDKFGIKIDIRINRKNVKKVELFKYDTKKIESIGFSAKNDIKKDILEILEYCIKHK